MSAIVRNVHNSHRAVLPLALVALLSAAALALCRPGVAEGSGPPVPGRTPKLREIAEFPEDYFGKEFTHTVWLNTQPRWLERANSGDFFLFVKDLEGTQLPNRGFNPSSTINLIRFVLPKEDARKLIDRLDPGQMYQARITFRVDREKDLFGQNWLYLARISSVELVNPPK